VIVLQNEIKVNKSKKAKVIKLIAIIMFIIISTIICIYLFPIIKNLNLEQGRIDFKNTVEKAGILGIFLLLGLQFSQMLLAIIPGEPIEILAGMCYGYVGGTLFMLITFFIFSALVFFCVRKIGINIVYTFCSEEMVVKIQNSKIFQNPKKVEKILYILYLLPGTPKDLFTYAAGLLPIEKTLRFLIISTLSRIPSIISSTIAGAELVDGSFKIAFISYALIYIIVILSIVIYKKITKDIDSDEALKDLKNTPIKKIS